MARSGIRAAAGRRPWSGCAAASPSSMPENDFDPVAFLQFNKDSPDQYPVEQIDNDHWEVRSTRSIHRATRSASRPTASFLCMMNNLRENNCSVFDIRATLTRRSGRRSRTSRTRCGGASIRTRFTWCSRSTARSSISRSCIRRRPSSGIMVVDTSTWTIKKEIQGIGPDLQTPAITYDGKYVLTPFSGFQRLVERDRGDRHRDGRADRHPAEHRRPPRLRHHPNRAGAHEAHPLVHALAGEPGSCRDGPRSVLRDFRGRREEDAGHRHLADWGRSG